jgi:RsiW-degrading membrane proteinase PrsW (M82 family)
MTREVLGFIGFIIWVLILIPYSILVFWIVRSRGPLGWRHPLTLAGVILLLLPAIPLYLITGSAGDVGKLYAIVLGFFIIATAIGRLDKVLEVGSKMVMATGWLNKVLEAGGKEAESAQVGWGRMGNWLFLTRKRKERVTRPKLKKALKAIALTSPLILGLVCLHTLSPDVSLPKGEVAALAEDAGLPAFAERYYAEAIMEGAEGVALIELGRGLIRCVVENEESDFDIEGFITRLVEREERSPESLYLLGYLRSMEERYDEALFAFDLVFRKEPNLPYLANSKGYALLKLGREDEAIELFFKELDLPGGNHDGAILNLEEIALRRKDPDLARSVLDHPVVRGMGPGALGSLELLSGRWREYIEGVFSNLGYAIRFVSTLDILLSGAILSFWLLYFLLFDIEEREPIWAVALSLSLPPLLLPLGVLLFDISDMISPSEGFTNTFLLALSEEVIKFLPILVLIGMGQVRGELDYLMYGVMSALGFATFENALYGAEILLGRSVPSTLGHICYTSLASWSIWAGGGNPLVLLLGLLLAALLHSIFNELPGIGVSLMVPVMFIALTWRVKKHVSKENIRRFASLRFSIGYLTLFILCFGSFYELLRVYPKFLAWRLFLLQVLIIGIVIYRFPWWGEAEEIGWE